MSVLQTVMCMRVLGNTHIRRPGHVAVDNICGYGDAFEDAVSDFLVAAVAHGFDRQSLEAWMRDLMAFSTTKIAVVRGERYYSNEFTEIAPEHYQKFGIPSINRRAAIMDQAKLLWPK